MHRIEDEKQIRIYEGVRYISTTRTSYSVICDALDGSSKIKQFPLDMWNKLPKA